jgi:flagellar biosynthesis component FlhA
MPRLFSSWSIVDLTLGLSYGLKTQAFLIFGL